MRIVLYPSKGVLLFCSFSRLEGIPVKDDGFLDDIRRFLSDGTHRFHHFIFQDLILFKIIFQNGNEVRRKFIDITDNG